MRSTSARSIDRFPSRGGSHNGHSPRGPAAVRGLLNRRLHLSKGQLVDLEGRLKTRQWDVDAGLRHWKTEFMTNSLEMLSGRGKKEYAKEVQTAVGDDVETRAAAGGSIDGQAEEIAIAM
jgi:hypothetical protein